MPGTRTLQRVINQGGKKMFNGSNILLSFAFCCLFSNTHKQTSVNFLSFFLADVVFLQFREEMRRVSLPPSASSLDAIKVLFVNAFPGQVSMPDFEMEEKNIYIKDHETGIFFQLDDVR